MDEQERKKATGVGDTNDDDDVDEGREGSGERQNDDDVVDDNGPVNTRLARW